MSTTQSSINPSPVRISEGEMGDEVGNKSESEVDELTSPADLNLFVEDLLEQMVCTNFDSWREDCYHRRLH